MQMAVQCWTLLALYVNYDLLTTAAVSGAADEPPYHEGFWYSIACITVGTDLDAPSSACA